MLAWCHCLACRCLPAWPRASAGGDALAALAAERRRALSAHSLQICNQQPQARGGDALAALAAKRAQGARLEDLTARVRTRLRLRRLARDPLLAPWQFEAAAGRLLQHASVLMQHAEGLSLRVSDGNRVEGAWVDIAWDAEP